jgi:hypothetical protein
LHGWGHAALLPVLFFFWWQWMRASAAPGNEFRLPRFRWLRKRRALPLTYILIALLSLISSAAYMPWSFDAATYRFPRVLYWWAAHRWHWIGTLDHRLDFSSCAFEWQMLPLIELTHSDRFLFLLNWIPFLLMPGLTFLAFRALGVRRRSAWRWMWLLPTSYCIALQASGVQVDGYSVNFVLAAIAFAAWAYRTGRGVFAALAIIAAASLTAAKVSNLPLLLPLGMVLLPALRRVKIWNWKALAVALLAVLCSFAPLAFLCWKNTGDWTGDPTDQWNVHTRNPIGGVLANAIFFVADALQLPIFPGSERVTALVGSSLAKAPSFMGWLHRAHTDFSASTVKFGDIAYEGGAGLGFGVCAYLVFLLLGRGMVKTATGSSHELKRLPIWWKLAPSAAWLAYLVYLSQLATYSTPRIAATYYPLLILSIVRCRGISAFETRRVCNVAALLAALSVIPAIILTPARPLIPGVSISAMTSHPALQRIGSKYQLWADERDDLAPMRRALPANVRKLGYAGPFMDAFYGLWKPLGSREVVELGLPSGAQTNLPPDVDYAVVTESGIRERYSMDLESWLKRMNAHETFEMQRNVTRDHAAEVWESWYLVKFDR